MSTRRKACDLCFTKKIKCDMIKPVCSNCILYESECKTGQVPLRTTARKRKLIQSPHGGQHHNSPGTSATGQKAPGNEFAQHLVGAWALGLVNSLPPHGTESLALSLPPRSQLLPVIAHYFRHANRFIPLIDQTSFMLVFEDWYRDSSSRTRLAWAAIHIVMALGLRTPEPGKDGLSVGTVHRSNEHLSNAHSAMAEVTSHDENLLGIQVLLGIIILFQNSSDQKPTGIVLASAMRLAHRLLLHSKNASQGLSDAETLQRSRVFWIAYALDKELSIRVKMPSIQSEDDMDLPLPVMKPPDGQGIIHTQDGRDEINLFRFRVELAHIQGKIYDLLYSVRAAAIPRSERRPLIARIQTKLDQWHSRIPLAFQVDHVASTVGPAELVQMTKLHHGYLMAEVMTHGFYSQDAEWVQRTRSTASVTISDIAQTQDQFGAARGDTGQDPPSASGWSSLVEISRGCLKLFHSVTSIECLAWQCSCGHFSSVMVLLANTMLHPSHPHASLDRNLTSASIQLFDSILQATDDKAFKAAGEIIAKLDQRADEAMQLDQMIQDVSASDESPDYVPQWDMPSLVDEWMQPSFGDDAATGMSEF